MPFGSYPSFLTQDPSGRRPGFFDRPGTTEMMLALGAGLAQAAYPAQGQSGWSMAPQAVLQALQARQFGAQNYMQDALFRQKMAEAAQKKAQDEKWQSMLMGGTYGGSPGFTSSGYEPDPSTGTASTEPTGLPGVPPHLRRVLSSMDRPAGSAALAGAMLKDKPKTLAELEAEAAARARGTSSVVSPLEQRRGELAESAEARAAETHARSLSAVEPINVKMPDGTVKAFNKRDPKDATALMGALAKGGTVFRGEMTLSETRKDDISAELGSLTQARERVSAVRQAITTNPSRAGVVGQVKSVFQSGAAILSDVARSTPVIGQAIQSLGGDIEAGRADSGIAAFFDPKLPEMDVLENSLAYGLARARKGSGRLNMDDLQNARADVKLKGLSSVNDVLARLDAIDAEIARSERDLKGRLKSPIPRTTAKRYRWNDSTKTLEPAE